MIDKSWIDKPIKSKEFLDGVVKFLDFAFSKAAINGKILCPCNVCGFYPRSRVEVFSPINDDLSDPSLSPNEVQLEEENEPLLVKVKDICTGETITRKMVATQVWHLEKTKKVLVQINGNGQGNDSGSNLLVRFLGQLAQKSAFCPVSVERWDEMSNDSSIEQWKCIEDHFEFDYAAGIRWVRSTLGDRWKAYKYKLRCHYFLPNKSKDEILATLPPGVDHVEWAAFVHHYKKETMQKLSEQNSKNRKNLKVSHAGGSKSNARRAHQMEQKLGRPVCRSEVKLSTLLKKNGNYVNEEGKVMADKISENLSEDQERVATKGVPSKINAYPDDAIGKLCGPEHAGRVRVLGLGVSPTYVFTNHMHFTQFIQTGSSSQMNVENLQNKVVDMEEKLEGYEETKQQLTQTTEELTQTKEKLAQATTKLTKVERFLQHKYGDELSMFDL